MNAYVHKVYTTLKKQGVVQVNKKGAYRDGVKREETSQGWDGSTLIVRPSETPSSHR